MTSVAWPCRITATTTKNALHIWQISEHWTHWTHWFISSDSQTKEGRRREGKREKKTCDDDVVYRLEKWVRSFAGTATHTRTLIRSFAVLLHSNFHVNPFGRFVVIIVKLFYAYFSARLISHLIPFFHSSVHRLVVAGVFSSQSQNVCISNSVRLTHTYSPHVCCWNNGENETIADSNKRTVKTKINKIHCKRVQLPTVCLVIMLSLTPCLSVSVSLRLPFHSIHSLIRWLVTFEAIKRANANRTMWKWEGNEWNEKRTD